MTQILHDTMAAMATRQYARLGYIPDLKDHRDRLYRAEVPVAFGPAVDLRTKLPPCYDQGELGSCTANAIAGAIQFVQQAQQHELIMPSRLFIYYNERAMEGTVGQDAGAQIRDGIKSVVKLGYCRESDWEYVIARFTQKPPDSCYQEALSDQVDGYARITNRLSSMLHCLSSGFPFVFGVSIYESFLTASSGDVPMPGMDEKLVGGHAMLCVGYRLRDRRFIFRNSWGTQWGDSGYGTIPFEYLESIEYGGDYWMIRHQEA